MHALVFALVVAAQDPSPPAAPSEGAVPVAPAPVAPASAVPTGPVAAAPVLAVGAIVDGWKIVSFTSEARLPDGRATAEKCGWVRDVVVERTVDGKPQIKRGVLSVPCDDQLAPGKPALTFPNEKQEAARASRCSAATTKRRSKQISRRGCHN